MGGCISNKNHIQKSKRRNWVSDVNALVVTPVFKNKNSITKEYRIWSEPLGVGAFGQVWKAFNYKTKEYWAIKIIYKKNQS